MTEQKLNEAVERAIKELEKIGCQYNQTNKPFQTKIRVRLSDLMRVLLAMKSPESKSAPEKEKCDHTIYCKHCIELQMNASKSPIQPELKVKDEVEELAGAIECYHMECSAGARIFRYKTFAKFLMDAGYRKPNMDSEIVWPKYIENYQYNDLYANGFNAAIDACKQAYNEARGK